MNDKELKQILKVCRKAAEDAWDSALPTAKLFKEDFLEEYDEEIENFIDELLAEEKKESLEAQARDEVKYGSYDDQVRSQYNGSRGV